MIACGNKAQRRFASKIISVLITLSFLFTSIAPSYAQGLSAGLSAPSTMLAPTASFYPVLLRAIEIDPGNPFHFGFIVDSGDTAMEGEALTEEAKKLIRYFLASLTTPEKDMWVNLSPYEKDRIIPEGFGQTQMGRDLLAQDYILKQLTASLIYPEDELGKKFWEKVYKAAYEKYGTTDIPIDTFNKIWILPKKATVYENNNRVFVVDSELAVVMEEDYVALQAKQRVDSREYVVSSKNQPLNTSDQILTTSSLSSQIVREIVLPAIEKEVNFGKHFASLRQVYYAMILATWYKNNLKESLLGKIYMDQNKIKGIDLVDSSEKQKIYEDYLNAFQKGIYDFIKVERDQHTGKNIPRKYFSGGFTPTTPDGTPLRQALEKVTPSADKLQTKGSATRFDAKLLKSEDDNRSSASAIEAPGHDAGWSALEAIARQYGGDYVYVYAEYDTGGWSGRHRSEMQSTFLDDKPERKVARIKVYYDENGNKQIVLTRIDRNRWNIEVKWGTGVSASAIISRVSSLEPASVLLREITSKLELTGKVLLSFNILTEEGYSYGFSLSDPQASGRLSVILPKAKKVTMFFKDRTSLIFAKDTANSRWKITQFYGQGFNFKDEGARWNELGGSINVPKFRANVDLKEMATEIVAENMALRLTSDDIKQTEFYRPNSKSLMAEKIASIPQDAREPLTVKMFIRDGYVVLHRAKKADFWEFVSQGMPLAEDKEEAVSSSIRTISKEEIDPFVKKLGMDNPGSTFNRDYFASLVSQYNQQMVDKQKGIVNDLVIGQNFFPNSMIPKSKMKEIMNATDFATEILSQEKKYLEAAKNVDHRIDFMNGGAGTSVGGVGAKSMALTFVQELQGFDKDGNPKVFKDVEFSILDVKYVHNIITAQEGRVAHASIRELVSKDTVGPISDFRNQHICLLDKIDDRIPEGQKRTYAQYVRGLQGIRFDEDMVVQAIQPVVDVVTGELTDRKTSPGGHGVFGRMAFEEVLTDILPEDKVVIRDITNGDGPNNQIPSVVLGWMASNKIPMVLLSSTTMELDKKGGKVGAQPVEDGLLLQDLTAENTRINMMETVQAGKVGQGELFQKIGLTAGAIEEAGQEGEQFFNTNIMGINETVLQPFLRELEKIIGHEQYVQWTSPTFIDNPKEGGTIYQIEGALGHVLQNLDYHVRYTENQKVKDLMKKYGWTRLLHIVNFTPEYRELCFTPVKFALDWNYYLSEHFAMDTKEWAMKNNKPGHLARFEFSKNYEDYYQKNKVNAYKILPLGSKTLDLDLLYVAGKWTLNKPEYIGTVELRNDTDQEINLDELLSKAKYQHYFDKGILKRGSDGHLILDNVTIVYVGVDIDGSGTDLLVAPTQSVSSTLASIPATTGREVAAVLIKEYQADPYFISGTDQDGNIKPFITAVWHAESQQLSESEKEYYGLDFRDYYYGWSETELPVTMHAFDQNGQIFLRLSENGKMYRSYDQKSKHKRMSSSLAVIKRAAGTLNAHEAIMALRKGIPHKTWSVEWNDSSYLEHEPGFTEFFSEKNLGSGQRLIVKFWEQNRNSPLTQIMIDQYDLFLSITALRFVWNDKKQNFDAVSEDNIARKAKEIIEKMPTSSASSSVITRQQLISPITRIMQDERSDVGTMGVKLRSGGYQRVSVTNPKAPWQDLDLREPVASIRLELGNGTSYYLNVRYEGKRAIIDANKVRTTFSQTETVAARIAPILMDKRNFRLGSSRDRESYLKVVSGSQEKNWQAVDQISANFSKERAVQKIKDLSAREKAVFIDIEQHSILEKDKIDQWLSRPGKPLAYQIRFQDGSYIYLVSKDLSYRDPVVSVTPKAAEVKSVVSEKRGYWPSDSAKIQRDVEEIISIIGREEKMETIKIFNPAMLYDANKLKLKDAIDRFKEKFSMLVTQKLEGIVLTFRTYSIEISVSKSTQQIIHVHVKDKQGMRLPGFDRSKLSSENVFSTALEKKEVPAVTYIDGVPSGEPAQRTLGLERYLEEKPVVSEVSKTASAKRGFLPSGSAKIQRDVKELLSVFDRNAKLQTIEIRNFNNSFRSYNALLGAQIADAVDAFRERFGDTISTMQFEIEDFRIIVSFEEFTRKVTEVSVFDKKFREHEKAVLQRYILSAENFLSTAPEEKRAEVKSETSKPETEIPYDADIVSRKERVSFKGAKFDVQEFSKRILDATKGKLLIDTGLDFDWRKNVIFSFSSQNKMDYRAMHKPAKNVSYMIVLRQVEDEMIEIEAEFQNSAGEMNHDEGLLRLATDILKSMSQEPGVVDAPQATAPAKLSELMPGEFRHQLLEFLDQLGVRELRAVNIFDGVSFYYFYSTKQIRESREEVAHALDGLVQEKSDMQSIEILWTANRVVIDLERGEVVGVRPGFATLGAGQEDIDRIRQNLPAGHFLSMARSEPLDETPTAMSQKASDVIEDLFRDFSNTIENYLGTDEIIYSPRLGEGNFGGFNGLITIKFTKTYERFKPYWVVSFERQPDGSVEIRAKSAPVYGATPNEDLELLELAKQTIVPDLGRFLSENFSSTVKIENNEEIVKSESSTGKRNIKDFKLTEISNDLRVFLEKLGEKIGLRTLDFKIGYYAVARQFDYAASRTSDPEAVDFSISSELNKNMGNIHFLVQQGKVVKIETIDLRLKDQVAAVLSELSEDNFLKTASSSSLSKKAPIGASSGVKAVLPENFSIEELANTLQKEISADRVSFNYVDIDGGSSGNLSAMDAQRVTFRNPKTRQISLQFHYNDRVWGDVLRFKLENGSVVVDAYQAMDLGDELNIPDQKFLAQALSVLKAMDAVTTSSGSSEKSTSPFAFDGVQSTIIKSLPTASILDAVMAVEDVMGEKVESFLWNGLDYDLDGSDIFHQNLVDTDSPMDNSLLFTFDAQEGKELNVVILTDTEKGVSIAVRKTEQGEGDKGFLVRNRGERQEDVEVKIKEKLEVVSSSLTRKDFFAVIDHMVDLAREEGYELVKLVPDKNENVIDEYADLDSFKDELTQITDEDNINKDVNGVLLVFYNSKQDDHEQAHVLFYQNISGLMTVRVSHPNSIRKEFRIAGLNQHRSITSLDFLLKTITTSDKMLENVISIIKQFSVVKTDNVTLATKLRDDLKMTSVEIARMIVDINSRLLPNHAQIIPKESMEIQEYDEVNIGDIYNFVLEKQRKSSSNLGGISMDSKTLDLQIKRDGNGIPLPISQQPPELMNIQGFTFEIMGITPVASLFLLSGLDAGTPSNKVRGSDNRELIGRPAEPALPAEEYAQVGLL